MLFTFIHIQWLKKNCLKLDWTWRCRSTQYVALSHKPSGKSFLLRMTFWNNKCVFGMMMEPTPQWKYTTAQVNSAFLILAGVGSRFCVSYNAASYNFSCILSPSWSLISQLSFFVHFKSAANSWKYTQHLHYLLSILSHEILSLIPGQLGTPTFNTATTLEQIRPFDGLRLKLIFYISPCPYWIFYHIQFYNSLSHFSLMGPSHDLSLLSQY